MSSIPTYQLNVCAVFPCKLGAYCVGSSVGQALPLECSHLLMDAVISLGS